MLEVITIRKSILFLIIFMLVSTAYAATSTLTPTSVYEGSSQWYNLSVNNFLQPTTINKVILSTPDFIVTGVENYTEWGYTKTISSIEWFGGTIETNVLNAIFGFEVQAPTVSSDANLSLKLQFRDTSNDMQNTSITVLVQNDTTAPVLSNAIPVNGTTVKAGGSQDVSITAVDPESGVKQTKFIYNNCTGADTSHILTCQNDNCSKTIDFSSFTEDAVLCYRFESENNGGETSTLAGQVTFDATPPAVALVDKAYQPNNARFEFDGSDNLASNLLCTLYINNTARQTQSFLANTRSAFNESLTDLDSSSFTWKVVCQDEVGFTAQDSSVFTHDSLEPTITLNNPSNGSLIKNTQINISVSDDNNLSSVNYSQPLDTSSWGEGEQNLVVTAQDIAGNINTETFIFYKDLTAPNITVISPADNEQVDYHVAVTLFVDDDYDTNPTCQIITTAGVNKTQDVTDEQNSTITILMPLGTYTWYAVCTDDVGNSKSTVPRTVKTVDKTGPDIVIEDLTLVQRGTPVTIRANITDISDVADAYAVFDGNNITLTQSGDQWSGTFTPSSNLTLKNYTITFYAEDTLGYTNSETDTFKLVRGYTITFTLNPSSASPSQTVSLTGTIVSDDNLNLSSQNVLLTQPAGSTNLTIADDNTFSQNFAAPSTQGTYDVKVSYETIDLVYSATEQLTVTSSSSSSNSNNRGGSNNHRDTTEDSLPSGIVESDPEPASESESSPSIDDTDSGSLIEDVPAEEPQDEEESRTPLGVGKATGWFSLDKLKFLWWILLIAAGILGGLYYYSKPKKPVETEKAVDEDKINWDNYFDRGNNGA